MQTNYPRTVHEFLRLEIEPQGARVLLHLRCALDDLRDLAHKNPEQGVYLAAANSLERQLRRLEQVLPKLDAPS